MAAMNQSQSNAVVAIEDNDANHTLEGIQNYLNQLSRYHIDQRNEQFYTRVSLAEANLKRIKHVISPDRFQVVKSKINELNSAREEINLVTPSSVTTLKKVFREVGGRGNRRYDIDIEHLEHLLSLGCSVTSIAKEGLLGAKLHPNTIHTFMKRNGIKSVRARYSDISDEDLQGQIANLNKKFPNSGICQIWSMLKTSSPPIIVQRDRVAKLLHVVDPVGATLRWAQVIPRRVYKVPTPNSLWHIDTHHKLIR